MIVNIQSTLELTFIEAVAKVNLDCKEKRKIPYGQLTLIGIRQTNKNMAEKPENDKKIYKTLYRKQYTEQYK